MLGEELRTMRTRVLSLPLHRTPFSTSAAAQSLEPSSSSLSTRNTYNRTLLVMLFFRMGRSLRQYIATRMVNGTCFSGLSPRTL